MPASCVTHHACHAHYGNTYVVPPSPHYTLCDKRLGSPSHSKKQLFGLFCSTWPHHSAPAWGHRSLSASYAPHRFACLHVGTATSQAPPIGQVSQMVGMMTHCSSAHCSSWLSSTYYEHRSEHPYAQSPSHPPLPSSACIHVQPFAMRYNYNTQ